MGTTASSPPSPEEYNRDNLHKFLAILNQIVPQMDDKRIELLSLQVIALGIKTNTETDFMVQRIRDRAIDNPDQSLECVKFGIKIHKMLPDALSSAFFMAMTMKALHAMYESMGIPPVVGTSRLGAQHAQATAMFYGNLFNQGDIIPSDLFKTVTIFLELGRSGEVSRYILQTIKNRIVERMMTEDPPNPFVKRLYEMITEEHMDTYDRMRRLQHVRGPEAVFSARKTDEPNNKYSIVTCSPLELLNRSNASRALMMASEAEAAAKNRGQTKGPGNVPRHLTPVDQKVIADFEAFLKSLKTPTQLTFNLERFKLCKDTERKQCALKFVALCIDNPTKVDAFAQVANRVLQTHQKAKGNEKSFIIHLQDACDERMKLFNEKHKNWMEIASFGLLLGQMYVLEVQKIYLMNQWLEKTLALANENDLALNMLFKVFKIVHEKMLKKDQKCYNLCLNELRKHKSEGRVPKIYEIWLEELFGEKKARSSSSGSVRSQSVTSNASSTTSSGSKVAQSEPETSTGAIKKIVPKVTETTQICGAFREYLNLIQNKQQAVPPTKLLSSAPDAAIQGIALLFIEHSLIYPEKSGIYVNIVRNIILTAFVDESRRNCFISALNFYLYAEMKKWLKDEKPKSSNWQRVNMLSVLLCELFLQNVIPLAVIQSWLDRLQIMAQNDCLEAAKAYNECVVKVGDKIGDENLTMIGIEAEAERSIEDSTERDFEMIEDEDSADSDELDSDSNGDGDFNLTAIKEWTVDELFYFININSVESSRKFAKQYFEFMLKSPDDHSAHVEIAKIIAASLSTDFGFRRTLHALLIRAFNDNCRDFALKRTQRDQQLVMNITKLIGSFYQINWIDGDELKSCMEKLAVNDFGTPTQLAAFHELLKIAGTKAATDTIDLKPLHSRLQRKHERTEKLIDTLRVESAIELVRDLWRLSRGAIGKRADVGEIRILLKDLRFDNIAETAKRVLQMEFFSFDEMAEVFVEISTENYENGQFYTELLAEIGEFACEDIDGVKRSMRADILERFTDRFGELVKEFKKSPKSPNSKAAKTEMLAILWLESNFLNQELITPKHIGFFVTSIQELKTKSSEADLDVIEMLVETTQFKIDAKILTKFLNKVCFERLKADSKSDTEMSFIATIDDYLKLTSLTDEMKLRILKDESAMKKFLEAVQVYCELNSFLIAKTVDFCKDLSQNAEFAENLSKFLESAGFLAMVKANDPSSHPKLFKSSVLLAANLYKNELIAYSALRPWLSSPMAAKFTYHELSAIVSLIKCNENDDVEVKIHNLHGVMHEKLINMCAEIKMDLSSFCEVKESHEGGDCKVN